MAKGRRPEPIRHGTHSGHNLHRMRGEDPCGACRSAENVYKRQNRMRGKCAPGLGWPLQARRD